jgi:hypothetical protein
MTIRGNDMSPARESAPSLKTRVESSVFPD